MSHSWPPSPCVEDEEVSLAKEHGTDVPVHRLKSENQPATSRGSVDQYPIIVLDTNVADDPAPAKIASGGTSRDVAAKDVSSHQQQAPSVPHIFTNQEKRFVYIPSQTSDSETELPLPPEHLQRSKSATQLSENDIPRGRPQVTRIHTDLGTGGLESMISGRRRAPSPYAHKSSGLFESLSTKPSSKDNLLSPLHAHEPRRPLSAHPGTRFGDRESSDSDHKSRQKIREGRSRSRAARESFSHSERSESDTIRASKSSARDKSPESKFSRRAHRYRSPAPSQVAYAGYTYTAQDHITPPQTPKSSADPARSSISDNHITSDASSGRHPIRRVTTDSPYTSSAEESYSRRQASGDERRVERPVRSRRSSRSHTERDGKSRLSRAVSQRRGRGSKDDWGREIPASDERSHRDSQTSLSARSPRNMESFIESAFIANQNKQSNKDNLSRPASPMLSPTQSPPQTPRGDRISKDYFDQPTYSKPPKHRSRPPSFDDGHFKDVKNVTSSLLGAATLGASLAAKAIPVLSRSHTSQSGETPSSGSQSRPSSGQRSRKPSPVTEEPQIAATTLSRTNTVASRDQSISMRGSTYIVNDERQMPQIAQFTHTMTPTLNEPHRISSRASSYSYSPDQQRPAAPYRALSSTVGSVFQQHPQYPAQQVPQSSPVNLEPVAMSTTNTARLNALQPCPRLRPVAGLHDWYTIRDLAFLDFCPTCMSFLGSSRFRDHFIPSLPKDPRRPVACAMGVPWLRYAWIQSIKQDRRDLNLIWQIAAPPPSGTRPCAGPRVDVRRWYHLTDPRTKKPVDNFHLCAACVRNVDLIFPKLQHRVFDRPSDKPEQDRICSFHPESRHFLPVLNEIERMADADRMGDRRQKDSTRPRDFQDFVDFVRHLCRYRQCQKDMPLGIQVWHVIPELPEFTICEECYNEVVRPVSHRPVARDVSKFVVFLPNLLGCRIVHGSTCQLYSDRMRRVFLEAVTRNDFEGLKSVAKHRYEMEQRLRDMQKLYKMDQDAGIDRGPEIERNITIWRDIE